MNDLIAPKPQEQVSPYYRVPVALSDGSNFVLSLKEQYICEVFLETNGNYSECARRVNAKFKKKHKATTIKTWMNQRNLLGRYLKEEAAKRAELARFTPEDCQLMAIEVLRGERKFSPVQAAMWQAYTKAYIKPDTSASIHGTNVQVNFLQADGKK